MSTRILALDTATEACSAALWIDGEISERYDVCPREHTQRILPMVDSLLSAAGIELKQLDALAYGRGPGSFTGVRIGIGIAQGLALGAGLPMMGISTLAALAQGAWRRTGAARVLCAIDARMGEVYWAQYCRQNDGTWLGEESEQVIKPSELAPKVAGLRGAWARAGTGWETYPDLVVNADVGLVAGETTLPAAADMLPLAVRRWLDGGAQAVELTVPTYLRNEVAWKKLPGRE
ncbi:tRNA (adenosine(37)-N6)-threonylcarbamoyltransferase complex dimerization subunit type 1 TsaB [Acerihabitans sp. TG2]|uniref:tRNA (adenosine(37)-N6)-threonylcarbamoyltransferase complex dimerization subunit type 1 TsaB n=1 Tax=Acerihabitans sp. TG2 TaxID=3096008 RepID=UPI002B22D77F|nr:tRNA (adenosine(37)-N6)-threonylcarbamoyltransferase complex dimerization subunit type 1 TsaB [Acerihabitans sp. TG2]MEA9389494.1 tRNA (adenosine(37)-N6)-threonylcarbamoyltransferase complex dimerization subunit type 1 TsaB [Acerihabitans sp. TG2]